MSDSCGRFRFGARRRLDRALPADDLPRGRLHEIADDGYGLRLCCRASAHPRGRQWQCLVVPTLHCSTMSVSAGLASMMPRISSARTTSVSRSTISLRRKSKLRLPAASSSSSISAKIRKRKFRAQIQRSQRHHLRYLAQKLARNEPLSESHHRNSFGVQS